MKVGEIYQKHVHHLEKSSNLDPHLQQEVSRRGWKPIKKKLEDVLYLLESFPSAIVHTCDPPISSSYTTMYSLKFTSQRCFKYFETLKRITQHNIVW